MQIVDKVIVVTGAGNGIGRHTALLLAGQGARIAAVDLNEGGLRETAALAAGARHAMSTHVADVSDSDGVEALAAAVLANHGQVDALINVAGIIHRFTPLADLSRAEMEKVMNVNFWGAVNTTRAFLPELRSRPEAGLVNVASLSALTPFAGQGFYGATKAALQLYTGALYQELADTNISVTAVFPGQIGTNLSANSGVEMLDAGGKGLKPTTPEETARMIVQGLRKGRARVVIGKDAVILSALARVAPVTAMKVVARAMKSVMGPAKRAGKATAQNP